MGVPGLDLALSYAIVRKHNGRIEVKSEPGKSAAFRVGAARARRGLRRRQEWRNRMNTWRATAMEADLSFTLLCVDDEANILKARCLLRPQGYRVLTERRRRAGGDDGNAGRLVISDMRMPDGRCTLSRGQGAGDIVRILMTGYADITSTVAAINKGEIYRYNSKQWEDGEVLSIVKGALERKVLEREKARLEKLTRRQNEELEELNASLESKVKARTEQLSATLRALEQAHANLKKGFLTSIKVFSNLIELREGAMAGHSRRVAELARRLAQHMKLSEAEVQDITIAALLHDIGKFGLPDQLLRKPFSALTSEERASMSSIRPRRRRR